MKNSFGIILKEIRLERDMSQEDFATLLGTTKQVISRYENSQRTPKITVAKEYADILKISLSRLLGENVSDTRTGIPIGFQPCPPTVKRPLVGRIACGEPITAEQNIEDMLDVPIGKGIDFCLTCAGESMIDAGIEDGDIVYIHQQSSVENGEIAAVRIGDEATLKRVYIEKDSVTLMPANPKYAPKTFHKEEMNDVQIEGLAVGFAHWF